MYSVYHKKLSLPIKLLFKIERPLNTFHPSSINPKNTLNFFGGRGGTLIFSVEVHIFITFYSILFY